MLYRACTICARVTKVAGLKYFSLRPGKSDWTGVPLDVEAYRKVVFEPYDLKVINGTIDF